MTPSDERPIADDPPEDIMRSTEQDTTPASRPAAGPRRATLVAGLLAIGGLLLSACATGASAPGSSSPSPDASPSATPATFDVVPGETLACGPVEFPSDALVKPVTLAQADDEVLSAAETAQDDGSAARRLEGAEDEWIVLSADDRQIALLHAVESDDGRPGESFDQLTLVWRAAGAEQPAEWVVSSSGACTLRADTGDLNDAALALDPETPASPEDTTVSLLAVEQACHGGMDAAGRVEVVSLVETEAAVEVVIGVRPDESADAWTCQSNPATPFTIELSQPLGDREIVDVGVIPAKVLDASGPAADDE
ncbi:hypothetical protein N8K70_07835 [Microbacterium betulae]|uniref:Uncharacterized protein n=1 Tax=Microbacterium betulae TaxID=2981139 RepID=A0AA97I688_9MICO|nr:hypothetical protein [Microbacterium sp. AB]WOF24556.1 hypothetical protein N8K70_07835 [Microbacterium sp. AB]